MKFYQSLFITLAYPKNIYKYKIPTANAILLYFISIASLVISSFYIRDYYFSVVSLCLTIIFIFLYALITDLIKIALIHFMASLDNKMQASLKLSSFMSRYFSIYSVFILSLPFAFVFKFTSFSRSIYSLFVFIFSAYYVYSLYRLIKNTYKTDKKLKTIIMFLTPLFYEIVRVVLLVIIVLSLTFTSIMQFIN